MRKCLVLGGECDPWCQSNYCYRQQVLGQVQVGSEPPTENSPSRPVPQITEPTPTPVRAVSSSAHLSLREVLTRLCVIAPVRVRNWNSGRFIWHDADGDEMVHPSRLMDNAAITHLMFSEMRDKWNGPRALPTEQLKALIPLFSNIPARQVVDDLIWNTYLAWKEATTTQLDTAARNESASALNEEPGHLSAKGDQKLVDSASLAPNEDLGGK